MKLGKILGVAGGLMGLAVGLYYSFTSVHVKTSSIEVTAPIVATDAINNKMSPDQQCANLSHLISSGLAITIAESMPAGEFLAPDDKTYPLPAFCRIHGIAKPSDDSEIHFEVWMPQSKWSGRYYQLGNGGFSGAIHYSGLVAALQQGNAVAATDDGHQSESGLDASWALNHPEKVKDWGHRAIKLTTDHAKSLIKSFYGKSADYNYFSGCSTGGRQALLMAQRHAEEWDGILAGAPSSLEQFFGFSWNEQVLRQYPENVIPPSKLPAIQRAALALCTADAYLVDDIATDPRFCRFEPSSLICEGDETDECLTAAQSQALKKLYQGPRFLKTGKSLYPGYEPTLETVGWEIAMITKNAGDAVQFTFGRQMLGNIIYDDPDWQYRKFDLDRDWTFVQQHKITGQTLGELMNSTDPDLSVLQNKAGKLLMYFGWGDTIVSPQSGINYYENVAEKFGSDETDKFFRLFMAPGMGHCAGGPGPNALGQIFGLPALIDDREHSLVRAMEAWVEQGITPKRITAVKYKDDKPETGVSFTRPLCPYPQLAVYKGKGSVNEAKNFACQVGANPGAYP